MKMKIYLTYNADNVRLPIIWQLGQSFEVVTNVRTADVKEHMGLVALELDGETEVVEQAVRWLQDQSVHVEPIEQNVVEG
ncbi:MAG: NIL domain-containing protein [Mariprofundaceae bacterium]|nr:NIL domain-containing protein [Mariprofundaceae bacterium]